MKKQLVYAIAIVALTLLVALSTMLVCFSTITKYANQAQPAIATPETQSENPYSATTQTKFIAVPGFSRMTMKAGQTLQKIPLYNPEENKCYMVISLILPDNKVLYRSGMLAPGDRLEKIEVERPLTSGLYENSVLQYTCYSLEDRTELNGAETIFTLEVLQ